MMTRSTPALVPASELRARFAAAMSDMYQAEVPLYGRLLDLVRGLVNDLGLSAIIVTHDLAVARLLSHRMMVMKDGYVIEHGLTDRVLDDPREPYTQLLVSSILQV